MSVDTKSAGGPKGPLAALKNGIGPYLLVLFILAVLDGLGVWLLYTLLSDGAWPVSIPIAVILVLVNVLVLSPGLFPGWRTTSRAGWGVFATSSFLCRASS